MTYAIRLPDGTLVENIPDAVPPEQAKAQILASRPDLGSTERTWGEAASDVGAALAGGVGQLLQVPGKISGLVTGDMSDTGLRGFGKTVEDYWKAKKSEGLLARKAQADLRTQEAEKDGQVSAFLTSLGETVKDPALLVDFLA